MDETPCRRPFCLDSLKIDEASIVSLDTGLSSNKLSAKYFSGIIDIFLHTTMWFEWNIILLASQTLTTLSISGYSECKFCFEITSRLWCAHDKIIPVYSGDSYLSLEDDENFPFDLTQFPALRHFKVQLPNCSDDEDVLPMLPLLIQLLSMPSSSGIEILEIIITWYGVEIGEVVGPLTCTEWVTLDEILSSEKFVSLKKLVLYMTLEGDRFDPNHRKKAHVYANKLFPTFRRHRTLESHLIVI